MYLDRLLFLLVTVDSLHLVCSLLSFSVPTLSHSFLTTGYLHTLPYSLPLAQVCLSLSRSSPGVFFSLCLYLFGVFCEDD